MSNGNYCDEHKLVVERVTEMKSLLDRVAARVHTLEMQGARTGVWIGLIAAGAAAIGSGIIHVLTTLIMR